MFRNDVKFMSMGDDDIRYYFSDAKIMTYSGSNLKKIEDFT